MVCYNELGYADIYVDMIKDIKERYNLSTVALAFPIDGIAEYVFIEENECSVEDLTIIECELTKKVLSIASILNLSANAGFETALCALSSIPNETEGLLLI